MIDFRVERGWSFDGFQVWLIEHRNGKSFIAKPINLEFVEISEGGHLPEPTLKLSGIFAREFIPQAKKALAGLTSFDDKEEYEVSRRVEKAMQAHIDSLKLVVDRSIRR